MKPKIEIPDSPAKVIAIIRRYCQFPDPPTPGTEESQYAELQAAVAATAGYFAGLPVAQRLDAAEYLLSPFALSDSDYSDRRRLIIFDVARSIVQTALNRASGGEYKS